MKIWVKKKRKDGKYLATYGSDSGWRSNKIVTKDTIIMDYHKGYEVSGLYIDPMEWPEKDDIEEIEEYAS